MGHDMSGMGHDMSDMMMDAGAAATDPFCTGNMGMVM
jgi:hypothetical protein